MMKVKLAVLSLGFSLLLTACAKTSDSYPAGEVNEIRDAAFTDLQIEEKITGAAFGLLLNIEPVTQEDEAWEENPFFFPSGRTYAGFYCLEMGTEHPEEVDVLIREVKRLNRGALYELKIDAEANLETRFFDGRDRLCLGYFYVTRDKIYLIQQEAADSFETEEELLAHSRIVCQEEDGEKENNEGWSETNANTDGSTHFDGERYYEGRRIVEGMEYSESFTWKRGVGLIGYSSSIEEEDDIILGRPIDYETAEERFGVRERNICKGVCSVFDNEWLSSQEEILEYVEESERLMGWSDTESYDALYCTYDFNDDGIEEYVVVYSGSLYSGTLGPRMDIIERTEDGGSRVIYRTLTRMIGGEKTDWNPIAVLDETVGGYHSFILPDKHGIIRRYDKVWREFKAEPEDQVERNSELYEEIIDSYYQAIYEHQEYPEQWQPDQYMEENGFLVPAMIHPYWSNDDADDMLGKMGFSLLDLNEDGVDELVMGWGGNERWSMEDGFIFAVYTIVDDTATLAVEGWERCLYVIGEEGFLYQFGTSGAAYGIYRKYRFSLDEKGYLEPLEELYSYVNANGDYWDEWWEHKTNPEDIGVIEYTEKHEDLMIDKEEATAMGDAWMDSGIEIDYTLFRDYVME